MSQDPLNVQNYRANLKEAKKKKREERKVPSKSYVSASGKTAGMNPLLGMIACGEGGWVKNLRIFILDFEEGQWVYEVFAGTGVTSYSVVGTTKLRKGFTLVPDFKLLPNEVAFIRAFYNGEAIKDFEYCLDYALEVR